LGDLHAVIQAAFGWENSHLHEFEFKKRRFVSTEIGNGFSGFGDFQDQVEDEDDVTVGELLARKGAKLQYTYDFGDNWRHTVVREELVDPDELRPLVLEGELACPPEDCGGIYGYYQLLDALQDAEHPEHEHYLDWIGPIDETAFDASRANKALKQCFK
jgi:hypothetical protein